MKFSLSAFDPDDVSSSVELNKFQVCEPKLWTMDAQLQWKVEVNYVAEKSLGIFTAAEEFKFNLLPVFFSIDYDPYDKECCIRDIRVAIQ